MSQFVISSYWLFISGLSHFATTSTISVCFFLAMSIRLFNPAKVTNKTQLPQKIFQQPFHINWHKRSSAIFSGQCRKIGLIETWNWDTKKTLKSPQAQERLLWLFCVLRAFSKGMIKTTSRREQFFGHLWCRCR